ncbi:MAG: amidohydrolase family protein [Mesorhizobium sp.]|nr:amidohydrolase family protein [Mesorhizobium sp.]MCO5159527.1 amidohydrolase family protein [Mesorhizobium sp.]
MTDTQPVRGLSAPKTPLPADSWECHSHVFGPFDCYPLDPGCAYQPPFGPLAHYRAMLDMAGFAYGVAIHASANGFDNDCVRDAAKSAPGKIRFVGVPSPDTPESEMSALVADGMCGIRITEVGPSYGGPKRVGVLGLEDFKTSAPAMAELGLYASIWAKADYLAQERAYLETAPVPVVLDHMGNFDPARGVGDDSFKAILGMLGSGNIWVKLTAQRTSGEAWDVCENVRAFHDALLLAAPDRCLFGSDWPYIMMDKNLPDIGGQIDLFDAWVADETLRRKVFVENPRALHGIA